MFLTSNDYLKKKSIIFGVVLFSPPNEIATSKVYACCYAFCEENPEVAPHLHNGTLLILTDRYGTEEIRSPVVSLYYNDSSRPGQSGSVSNSPTQVVATIFVVIRINRVVEKWLP